MARRRRRSSVKNKAVILAVWAAVIILLGTIVFLTPRIKGFLEEFTRPAVKEVDVSGLNSYYSAVITARGGKVLGEQNGHERMYPASMTKMMTAIVALDKLRLSKEITFTWEMLDALNGSDATQAGYQAGETAKVEDILYGIILPSGADCCMAVAYEISGSEEAFVELMNRKAEKIGMKDTHFCNTTGLHNEDHYSTAYDMAILLKYCLRNKTFRKIITSPYHSSGPTNVHPDGITVYSTMFNNLSSTEVTGGEILGGKTGFTNAAGFCLASFAEIDGREYIVVTGGASGATGAEHVWDALEVYNRIGEQLR